MRRRTQVVRIDKLYVNFVLIPFDKTNAKSLLSCARPAVVAERESSQQKNPARLDRKQTHLVHDSTNTTRDCYYLSIAYDGSYVAVSAPNTASDKPAVRQQGPYVEDSGAGMLCKKSCSSLAARMAISLLDHLLFVFPTACHTPDRGKRVVQRLGGGAGTSQFVPVLGGDGTKKAPPGDLFDQPPGEMSWIRGKLADHVGDHVVLSPEGVVLVTSPGTESLYPLPPQMLNNSLTV